MSVNLRLTHHDLVTPDGKIISLEKETDHTAYAEVYVENISPSFLGFSIPSHLIFFNLKSTIAQLGVTTSLLECSLSPSFRRAEAKIKLEAIDEIGKCFLNHLTLNVYVGKLFASDPHRLVRDPIYLSRMFGRTDYQGRPLLSLGEKQGKSDLILQKIDGRTVAFLPLKQGVHRYPDSIKEMISIFIQALAKPEIKLREFLRLTQVYDQKGEKKVKKGHLLLVNTVPLHIRTVFARVVESLLPDGVHHTSASILQPDTMDSGDIYEFYGSSEEEIKTIPLEFYTLSPYREYVFFKDRDQLQSCIEDSETLFKAMDTAPLPLHHKCATFVAKGEQLLNLKSSDWLQSKASLNSLPGFFHPAEQAEKVEEYLRTQPSYPFLEAMEQGAITSQGILLTRYFPSPVMKRMLLSHHVHHCLKGIYFQYPSRSYGDFFSHEDRSLLVDLTKFGIHIFWLDKTTHQILQYVPRPDQNSGMFVPLKKVQTFIRSTILGVYGSNLIEKTPFAVLIQELLEGLQELKKEMFHPLLNIDTPLALVTGGGPGIMRIGNEIAQKLGILSCANIVDFRTNGEEFVNEQKQNPFIEAKMTYRLDRLVERQAEFHLDLPIFLMGGVGTDFEYSLEELRRKVSAVEITPILLVGDPSYWEKKITPRFQINLETGTISGSEWVSNCFYCIKNAKDGLKVYEEFFSGKLPIGPKGPIDKRGFTVL